MRRTLLTAVPPALVVVGIWLRLERPTERGAALLVAALALVPALVRPLRPRIATALVVSLAGLGVGFGSSPVAHPGRVASAFANGFLDFYDVRTPFDPRVQTEMRGVVLTAIFGFCVVIAFGIAHARPLVAGMALVALGLLLLVAAIASVFLAGGDGGGGSGVRASARLVPIPQEKFRAMSTFDPQTDGGDGHEHNEKMTNATDGDPGTYWPTEHYRAFTKPGVGLVLEATDGVRIRRVTVRSDTPGFTAEIRAGSSTTGPWRRASSGRTVGASTTFAVDGRSSRFFEIWITKLPQGVAHVNEVTARGTD
jgi:hypothetical protein